MSPPVQIIAGNFGLSYEQQKAQFALWAIFAAVSHMTCTHAFIKILAAVLCIFEYWFVT